MFRLALLLSHYYILADPKEAAVFADLSDVSDFLIDSGAFTLHSAKQKGGKGAKHDITLESYNQACRDTYDGRAWGYIQLDEIGDPAATLENLKRSFDAGVQPVAVWEKDQGEEEYRAILGMTNRVCVPGPAVPRYRLHYRGGIKWWYRRVQQAWRWSERNAELHGLGFARYPECFQLPLHSFDASSATSGNRWGLTAVMLPGRGLRRLNIKDMRQAWEDQGRSVSVRTKTMAGTYAEAMQYVLARSGVTSEQIYAAQVGPSSVSALLNVGAHIELAEAAHRRGAYYFMVANGYTMAQIVAAFGAYRGSGIIWYPDALAAYMRLIELRKTDWDGYLRYLRVGLTEGWNA